MRLPGYCTECRRQNKTVRVPAHLLWKIQMGQVPEGVCADCEDKR